jgi:hypothetical protein
MTVNETIQVPNKVLPPGTYVVKLLDSPSDRRIVQIFNADENELITTILAIPNYRLEPTGNTVFTFWEMPRRAQSAEGVVLSWRQLRAGVRISEDQGGSDSGDLTC